MKRAGVDSEAAVAIESGWEARALLRPMLQAMAFALAAIVAAHVRVWLPFSPVPVTLQTFVVLSAGLCLGAGWGGISQAKYLALGFVGLPAFSGGLLALAGPTGGYLVGFVAAAVVTGAIYSRMRSTVGALLACAAGTCAIYLLGCLWLGVLTGFDLSRLLAIGVLPFLAGDLIKLVAAVLLVRGPLTGPFIARVLGR